MIGEFVPAFTRTMQMLRKCIMAKLQNRDKYFTSTALCRIDLGYYDEPFLFRNVPHKIIYY